MKIGSGPIHVALIDDDPEDVLLIKGLLKEIERANYVVEEIRSSSEALEKIKKQQADVYIIDYRLGATTSLEILDEIRSLGLEKPIILLTGQGDHDVDLAAMEKGAADFLSKNHVTSELLERSIRYSMKRSHDQLALKAAERSNAEREAAEIANHAKSQFLANMSHEIRTPLSAILGFANLALDEETTDEEKQGYLSTIKRNGEFLLELINDILDLSKIEAGHMAISLTPTDWRAIIVEVADLFAMSIKSKGLELKFEFQENLPNFFLCDSKRFKQVVLNLLSNAVKFTKCVEL